MSRLLTTSRDQSRPPYAWYKVDARGNTSSINAQFNPPLKQLAFQLESKGEKETTGLFAEPAKEIIQLLEISNDIEQVYQRLSETDVQIQ